MFKRCAFRHNVSRRPRAKDPDPAISRLASAQPHLIPQNRHESVSRLGGDRSVPPAFPVRSWPPSAVSLPRRIPRNKETQPYVTGASKERHVLIAIPNLKKKPASGLH